MEPVQNPSSEDVRVVLRLEFTCAGVAMRSGDVDMNSPSHLGGRTDGIERGGMLPQKLDMILCVVSRLGDGLGALFRSSTDNLNFDFDLLVETFENWDDMRFEHPFSFNVGIRYCLGICADVLEQASNAANFLICI